MSGSRLVRGTRSRLFLYLAVVVVVGMAVYVFHGAQLQLDDARKVADKCQQQQESLSAQLQVIFEYKLRLEKSLQQEKGDHRKTREELEKRADSEKVLREKESLEANNKYSSLQQQYKLLESQHEDLSQDCHKVRMTQLQGLEERSKLESQVQAVQAELAQVQAGHKKSLNSLKSEYTKLEEENTRIEKQNSELLEQSSKNANKINFLEKENLHLQRELLKATKKQLESYQRNPPPPAEKPPEGKHDADNGLKSHVRDSNAAPSPSPASSVSSPAGAAAPDVGLNPDNQLNVLQQPLVNQDNADNKVSAQRSTTPQINPEALLSQDRIQQANNVAPVPPPRHEKHEDAKEQVHHEAPNLPRPVVDGPLNNWRHANVPAGVVPAPQGYAYHHNAQDVVPNKNEESNAPGRWAVWPRFRHIPQPIDPAHLRENNLVDDNGPEEEEEDPAHPHRSAHGEQQEIPRQLHNPYQYNGADYDKEGPRGDIQLEEGEEEEDDDMDQLDDGDEAGGEGARRNKMVAGAVNKQPVVNKKDGVMLIPK